MQYGELAGVRGAGLGEPGGAFRGSLDGMKRTSRRPRRNPSPPRDEFWEWFGESVVRDSDGMPLAVFHGTAASFESFDPAAEPVNDDGYLGVGTYFETDFRRASQYALMAADATGTGEPRVVVAYLRVANPYLFGAREKDTSGLGREEVARWTMLRVGEGFDGVHAGTEWVVFSPDQILTVCSVPIFDPYSKPKRTSRRRR